MSVNWHNVVERVVATTWQGVVAAAAAGAEAVSTGALDWRTYVTGVAVAGLMSLAKNLQAELAAPNTPNVVSVPSDRDRAALTRVDVTK